MLGEDGITGFADIEQDSFDSDSDSSHDSFKSDNELYANQENGKDRQSNKKNSNKENLLPDKDEDIA